MNPIYYPVTEPDLSGNEKHYVDQALDEKWISSQGSFVERFERDYASFCGTKYAISCSNGTVALHLILAALGIGPGDEVLVPSFTFVATANAVSYTGATPIFVDSSLDDWNLDPLKLNAALTAQTRAVIAVHLYGRPCKMKPIADFAKQHQLFLIEDAAEAHGAKVDGQLVGSFGLAASFSFYGNKIITTGEGGMVTTSDHDLATRMRILKGQGMDPRRRYWFTMIGFNYRMTNLAAALGCAQLERIDHLIQARKRIANWYVKHLEPIRLSHDIQWLEDLPGVDQVSWLFSLRVPRVQRDPLIEFLSEMGIDTRPFFIPLHTLPMYSDGRFHGNRPLDGALILGSTGISLPTYSRLTEEDVLHISSAVIQFMRQSS